MAFQAPNAGQERQNRKILEQLEEQKRKLRMQTQTTPGAVAGSVPATTTPSTNPASSQAPVLLGPENQHMTPAQRAALQHAHANSVGYFITQDSSFGNLILPVLPRLVEK